LIRKHLFWDYLGRFSGVITQILTSIVLTRLLSPKDFGIVGIALAVNGIARLFGNFGFSSYIIQQEDEDERTTNSVFWFSIALAVVLFTIILLSSTAIADFYNMAQLSDILVITGLLLVFGMTGTIPNALLIKRLEFKAINIRNIGVSLFSGIVGVALAYNGFGVWSLIIQQITNSILSAILAFIIAKWRPKLIFSKYHFLKSYHFGKYMFLSSLVDGIYSKLDVFLVGKLFSLSSLGLYTRAQTLDGTVSKLSAHSLLNVLFPTIAKIKNDPEKLKTIYYTYFEHITFVFCLMSSLLYLGAIPLFFYLFGEIWLASAVFFKLLVLSSFASPLASLMLAIIEAQGNSKNFFYADVFKKLIFLPGYIVVWFFSIETFLLTLFLLNILGSAVNLYYLNKEIIVGYLGSTKILLKYFIPSIGLAVLIDLIYPSTTDIVPAIIKIAGLLTVYIGICYYQKSKTLTLGINFIRAKYDKRY